MTEVLKRFKEECNKIKIFKELDEECKDEVIRKLIDISSQNYVDEFIIDWENTYHEIYQGPIPEPPTIEEQIKEIIERFSWITDAKIIKERKQLEKELSNTQDNVVVFETHNEIVDIDEAFSHWK